MTTHTRQHIHMPNNLSDAAADRLTSFFGSWLCIGLHTVWFVVWFVLRLDINLLTLIVSLEAIYLSTIIMISQNRHATRDRDRDDLEATEISSLFSGHQLLLTINQQQLDMLHQQAEILDLLKQSRLKGGRSTTDRPLLS